MDAAEFAQVGSKIVEIGMKLKGLREEREALSTKITELEKELLPLVSRHSELLALFVGVAMPKPAPLPVPPSAHSASGMIGDEKVKLTRRIKKFLEDAEPGTSAMQIAEALKVDAAQVREVLRDFAA